MERGALTTGIIKQVFTVIITHSDPQCERVSQCGTFSTEEITHQLHQTHYSLIIWTFSRCDRVK